MKIHYQNEAGQEAFLDNVLPLRRECELEKGVLRNANTL